MAQQSRAATPRPHRAAAAVVVLSALLCAGIATGTASAGTTTINDGYLAQGWQLQGGPVLQYAFTARFGAPTGGGAGALALTTQPGDRVEFVRSGAGRALSDFYFTTGAYYGYRSSASTASADAFPNFVIDADVNGAAAGGQTRFYYDPAAQRDRSGQQVEDLSSDAWHRFDYARGAVCSTKVVPGVFDAGTTGCANGGAKSLREVLELYPEAAVEDFGFTQSTDSGRLAAAVDNLNVGDDVYDFEPTLPAPVDPGGATPPPSTTPPNPTPPKTAPPETTPPGPPTTTSSVRGAGTLFAGGQRYAIGVNARSANGRPVGQLAISGDGRDTTAASTTLSTLTRSKGSATLVGTAFTSAGRKVTLTVRVQDRPGKKDQVSVTIGERSVSGTLASGNFTVG